MFKSTRGASGKSSMEAILDGLAGDGGLYVIDKLPKIDYNELFNMDYPTMASVIIKAFFDELSYADILKEVRDAYKAFDSKNVVELRTFRDISFLELFHGPTLAFKDLALVVLPRLMKLSRLKLGYDKKITILTATSGDTGGAALNGFKGVSGVNIIVLYPNNGVSEVQEAQMHSFRDKNSLVYAVNGNFDDCQSFVKSFFSEHKDLSLSSANSINIGRLVPQIAYYFYSYIYLAKNGYIKNGDKITFSVPTGNFGNIFAGFYAKKMGLPIKCLISASNKNDVLAEYLNTGIYDKNREFYKTNSPSMDILLSSNFERFIYYMVDEDSSRASELMRLLNSSSRLELKCPYSYMRGYMANEEETLAMIRDSYKKYNYLIDPHTAVAYKAAMDYKSEGNKEMVVVVATASPFKFPDAIMEAFGLKFEDKLLGISKHFSLSIPSVLNYKEYSKAIVELKDLATVIEEVIKCLG